MKTETQNPVLEITYCSVDQMYYFRYKGETVFYNRHKQTDSELQDIITSDDWSSRFKDMQEGKVVRVSARIFDEMLGAVPPINQTENSFFCGEAYDHNSKGQPRYYFFERVNGICYGQIKEATA